MAQAAFLRLEATRGPHCPQDEVSAPQRSLRSLSLSLPISLNFMLPPENLWAFVSTPGCSHLRALAKLFPLPRMPSSITQASSFLPLKTQLACDLCSEILC